MTVIDENWGNPTAELLAYLEAFSHLVQEFPLRELICFAVDYFLDKDEYQSEHEIYCFVRLYRQLPHSQGERLRLPLQRAVRALLVTDPRCWQEYVPRPLDFAPHPRLATSLGLTGREVNSHLQYLVDRINEDGGIWPHWSWGTADGTWERAKKEWAGQLTLLALFLLEDYSAICW